MKDLTLYINESILDMDEEKSDNAVEIDTIYHELVEEFGSSLVYKYDSYAQPITKEDITIKGNKLYFPDHSMFDLTIMPDAFKKYKIANMSNVRIRNYQGKVSKLPFIKVESLILDNCRLDFDKKLNVDNLKMKNCGVDNLKIGVKQPWKSFEMDSMTQYGIANKYIETLAPGIKEWYGIKELF